MKNQLDYPNYYPPEFLEFNNYLCKIITDKKDQIIKDITFQITEDCCMACTYCYQHHKTKYHIMDFQTAKNIIDNLLSGKIKNANTDNVFGVIINFIGGEPFLEVELIDKIINYILTQMINQNHPWLYYTRFGISSNGLLYNTKEVQNLFKKYNYFISYSVSIDGNKELHDSCRLDLQGNGTYDRVIDNIQLYYSQNKTYPPTKMTISPQNVKYVYSGITNLIELGYKMIPINCIFEKGWTYKEAKILLKQLILLADYLIDNELYNKVNVRLFQEEFYQPMNKNDNDNWCGGVNSTMLAFDYKGNLYPCIRYMESSLNGRQKPLIVGNLYNNYNQTKEQQENIELLSNITRKSQSTDECFNCPIAKGCSWCSGYNYEEFGTPNKRATYICPMHQAESLANVYYWNKLYRKLNLNKRFKMYIPKDWALNIIDEQEYNRLLELSKEKGE